jgi:hypothetical protein
VLLMVFRKTGQHDPHRRGSTLSMLALAWLAPAGPRR